MNNKSTYRSNFFVGVLGLVMLICVPTQLAAQGHPTSDKSAQQIRDEGGVRAAMQAWLAAYNAGDIEALIALYDEDIFYANNGSTAIRDITGIQKGFGPALTSHNTNVDFREEQLIVGGEHGYIIGLYQITGTEPENKNLEVYGRVMLVFRKDDEGAWKLIVDFDNTTPDATASVFQ